MSIDNKGQVSRCQRNSRGAVVEYSSQRSSLETVHSRQQLLNLSEITGLGVRTPEKGFLELVAICNFWHL